MTARHFVAHRQLALHGNVGFNHLDDAGREFVSAAQFVELLFVEGLQHLDLLFRLFFQPFDRFVDLPLLLGLEVILDLVKLRRAQPLEHRLGELGLFFEDDLPGAALNVFRQDLAGQDIDEPLRALFPDDADLVVEVLLHLFDLLALDGLGALVLGDALAREDLHVDHGSFNAGRRYQAGIAYIARLLSENRAEQLFFRGQLRLALRSHLPDQDIPRADLGPDPDDAALVQIPKAGIAYIGDIARNLFGTELGIARFDLQLLNVDRSIAVLFHQFFADQDRIFKVVATPGHEGHQDVAPERELALVRARPVREDLRLEHTIAPSNQRHLIDAGVLVGALEFGERVDIHTGVTRALSVLPLGFHSNDDARGVHAVHDAAALADHDGAGILGGNVLHSGPDVGGLRAQQRDGLALHVGTHQRPVRVVMLQERNQARSHTHKLLGRDIDEINVLFRNQDEVPGLARVHAIPLDVSVLIELDVRLGDGELFGLPGREIEGVRLILRRPLAGALHLAVFLFDNLLLHLLAHLQVRVARENDVGKIQHPAALHFAVGRFDEAVFVNARVAAQ